MTTNTTNSQAASIDTPEFWVLLNAREEGAMDEAHAEELEQDIVKFIDAKLAQARVDSMNEGLTAGRNEYRDAYLYQKSRAEKAESRLDEIQRGVEGLRTYFIAAYSHPAYDPKFVALQDVLALLAPQDKPTGCTHNCNQGRDCTCK